MLFSIKTIRIITEPYHDVIFDQCRQEYVDLSGTLVTKVTEKLDGDVTFKVDLNDVTGVGETSGTIYHGRSTFIASDIALPNSSKNTFLYHSKYVADNGNQIFNSVKTHVIIVNGDVKVEYSTVKPGCR